MNKEQIRLEIVKKLNSSSIYFTPEEISYIVSRYVEQHSQKRVEDISPLTDAGISITMDTNSLLKNH